MEQFEYPELDTRTVINSGKIIMFLFTRLLVDLFRFEEILIFFFTSNSYCLNGFDKII